MIEQPNPPVENILDYVEIDYRRSNSFNIQYTIDENKVDIRGVDEFEVNSSLDDWNSSVKSKRQEKFNEKIENHNHSPVLVSEGDSWFQFPCLTTGNDIIDYLDSEYLIWSMGEAGDTLTSIYNSSEYMSWFGFPWSSKVKAFLLSAAGNDVIGEVNGKSVLQALLREYDSTMPPGWHIERKAFTNTLNSIEWHYMRIIEDIHATPGFRELPILIHGYDYPFPHPSSNNDYRNPCLGPRNQWLGQPFKDKGFPENSNSDIRRTILILMIDELYGMMFGLQRRYRNVHVVDLRNSLPKIDSWRDELHGSPSALNLVSDRFKYMLNRVI